MRDKERHLPLRVNEITYQIEAADLKAVSRYVSRNSPQMKRLIVFGALLFAGLSLNFALREKGGIGLKALFFTVMFGVHVLVASVIGLIFYFLVHFRTDRGRQPGLLGRHTITLTPDGLREQTDVNDQRALWQGIQRIEANGDYIFIYMQPNAAHVIPRRAFPSPEEAEQFLAAARAYHAAAKPSA